MKHIYKTTIQSFLAITLLSTGLMSTTTVNAAPSLYWKTISGSSCHAGAPELAAQLRATDMYGLERVSVSDPTAYNWVYCPIEIDGDAPGIYQVYVYYTKKAGSGMRCYLNRVGYDGSLFYTQQYPVLASGNNKFSLNSVPVTGFGRLNLWCELHKVGDAVKLANYRRLN